MRLLFERIKLNQHRYQWERNYRDEIEEYRVCNRLYILVMFVGGISIVVENSTVICNGAKKFIGKELK
ncbi:MAG: hypothetical protein ACOWWR_03170 [Eubacteriales bacterium]